MLGGIDLSVPAVITFVGAIVVHQSNSADGKLTEALVVALVIALLIGLINGLLVAVLRLNALIVTLAKKTPPAENPQLGTGTGLALLLRIGFPEPPEDQCLCARPRTGGKIVLSPGRGGSGRRAALVSPEPVGPGFYG